MSDKTITTPSTLSSSITETPINDSTGIKWTNIIIFATIIAVVYFFYIKNNNAVTDYSVSDEINDIPTEDEYNPQCITNEPNINSVDIDVSENDYKYTEITDMPEIQDELPIQKNTESLINSNVPISFDTDDDKYMNIKEEIKQPQLNNIHTSAPDNCNINKQQSYNTLTRDLDSPVISRNSVNCNLSNNINDPSCYIGLDHKNINMSNCSSNTTKKPECSLGNNIPGYDDSNYTAI
jgi:hypothetical protein